MQRIRVDLPDPEGPQITTFSRSKISRSTSFKAWNGPGTIGL
jgi:hypothetical protein